MRTLTVTAVLAIAATALTGCGRLSFGTHGEDRSYTAPAGITALKVESSGSRVEITATDSPVIKVKERLRWSNDNNKPKSGHVTEGNTLTLTSTCATQVIGDSDCGISYRIEVPRSTPVRVDNNDGSINATGLTGVVKLHSDNGSINVRDLNASMASLVSDNGSLRVSGKAGTAYLDSDNGSIDATGLTTGKLTAHSADGRIRLSGHVTTADVSTDNGSIEATGLTTGKLTAKTSDGSISLGFTTPPGNVSASSDNGSISVRVPGGRSYAFDMSTDNGSKSIDPAIKDDSGSQHHITLKTSDGSIAVNPA